MLISNWLIDLIWYIVLIAIGSWAGYLIIAWLLDNVI